MTSFYLDSEIGQNKLVNPRNFAIAASIGVHGLLLASVVPNMSRSIGIDPAPRDLKNVGVIELNQFERSRLPDLNPSPGNLPGGSEVPGVPGIPSANNSLSPLPDLPPLGSLDSPLPPLSSISPPPSLPSLPSLPALPPSYSSLPSSPSLPSLRVYNPPVASLPSVRSGNIPPPPRISAPPPNVPVPPSVPTISGNNPYPNNFPVPNLPPNPLSPNNPDNNRSARRPDFDPYQDYLTPREMLQSPIRASDRAREQLRQPVTINPAPSGESPLDIQRRQRILDEMRERLQALQPDKTNTTDDEALRNQVDWLARVKNTNPEALNELNRPNRETKGISIVNLTGNYPVDACSRKLAGTAVYGVTVNGAGVPVSEPQLLKSAGFPILNQQAAREVRSTRFNNPGGGSRIYQVKVSYAPSPDVCRGSLPRPSGNESNPIETRTTTPPAPDVQTPIRDRARPNPLPNPETNPRPENLDRSPVPTPSPATVVEPKPPEPPAAVVEPKPAEPPAAVEPKTPEPPAAVEPKPSPSPAIVEPKAAPEPRPAVPPAAKQPEAAPPRPTTRRTVEPAPEPRQGRPNPESNSRPTPPRAADPAPEPPQPAEAKPAPVESPGSEG